MAKILLLEEDDVQLARTVKGWLSLEHHSVETVHNGQPLDYPVDEDKSAT